MSKRIPESDLPDYVRQKVHVEGWNPSCVFVLVGVVGRVKRLMTPVSKRYYETTNNLLRCKGASNSQRRNTWRRRRVRDHSWDYRNHPEPMVAERHEPQSGAPVAGGCGLASRLGSSKSDKSRSECGLESALAVCPAVEPQGRELRKQQNRRVAA